MSHKLSVIINDQQRVIDDNAALQPSAKRWKHSLSFAKIDAIYAAQGYKCGICGEPRTERNDHKLDHDHVTGMVRGVLCNKCNLGLGLLGDSIKDLTNAIKYIEISILFWKEMP